MKTLLSLVVSLLFLNSCVFEAPFEPDAKFPVDTKLLGRWEETSNKEGDEANEMLVLQYSANEYVVEYPVGERAMFFRAYAVELSGGQYIQIQLIGSANERIENKDRKFHLLKVGVDGDALELRTLNSELLGESLKDTARMKAAFEKHRNDPKLFAEPGKFKRVE